MESLLLHKFKGFEFCHCQKINANGVVAAVSLVEFVYHENLGTRCFTSDIRCFIVTYAIAYASLD